MDASDWEPLPPEQLGLHPGEHTEPCKADLDPGSEPERAQPVRPNSLGGNDRAADQRAEARARAGLEPAQARALALLQKKMRSVPKTRSLVGEIADREHKQQRRRRAAQATGLTELAQVQCAVTAADIPLEIDYATGLEGRDPREDEAWFEELPVEERERLHAQWAHKREQSMSATATQRRNRGRRAASALLIFAATCVLGMPGAIPVLALAGVVCSIVWSYIAPCRYRDPIVALSCLVLVTALVWAVNGAGGRPPVTFIDAMLVAVLAALAGFDAEIRRNGGFDNCR